MNVKSGELELASYLHPLFGFSVSSVPSVVKNRSPAKEEAMNLDLAPEGGQDRFCVIRQPFRLRGQGGDDRLFRVHGARGEGALQAGDRRRGGGFDADAMLAELRHGLQKLRIGR